MSSLVSRRCFNHARREAAARCPICGNFFCRECVTEHDGRMICARCLAPGEGRKRQGRFLAAVVRCGQLTAGLLVLWLAFFLVGEALLAIPASFHDGNFLTGAKR